MKTEYLATGFKDVDNTHDKNAYFDCLTLLDSLPYYREYKIKSYELLDLKPGLTVLDAGCGLGNDAFRMAERVVPGGRMIGLDASSAMIEKAGSHALAAQLPVKFLVGDVTALSFPDNVFARCRADRVLQHIREPNRAIAELVRVLEPGGLLLAYDNDWSAFSITSNDVETTRIIERLWRNSFANSLIGRNLCNYFLAAGLSDIGIHPGTSVITDFATADNVYNLQETMRKATASGVMTASQGQCWIEELISRTSEGSFRAELTSYTVVGRKC